MRLDVKIIIFTAVLAVSTGLANAISIKLNATATFVDMTDASVSLLRAHKFNANNKSANLKPSQYPYRYACKKSSNATASDCKAACMDFK